MSTSPTPSDPAPDAPTAPSAPTATDDVVGTPLEGTDDAEGTPLEGTDDAEGTPETTDDVVGTPLGGTDDAVGTPQEGTDDAEGTPETTDDAPAAAGSHADLVREGEIAADFLETFLDIADLDGDLEVDVEGDRAAVAIVDSEDGRAPQRLVGAGGAVLDALQELTRLAVQAETGERSRLMLDVAGYRSDRRTALVRTAQQAIAEVQQTGERRELEPMTAFERKVVHDEALAAGLVSESEGMEPDRYVVILPAS